MPRVFDSDDQAAGSAPLVYSELVDCPKCGCAFDALFADDSISESDMTDPPGGMQICPGCNYEWMATMSGWCFWSEAG